MRDRRRQEAARELEKSLNSLRGRFGDFQPDTLQMLENVMRFGSVELARQVATALVVEIGLLARDAQAETVTPRLKTQACQEKLTACAARIQKLEHQVEVQKQRLASYYQQQSGVSELEAKIAALEKHIDTAAQVEERFATDTRDYVFKSWVEKHPYHAQRPGCKRLLDKASGFPPRGSRGTYTEAIRRAYFSLDEKEDVWDAWKDMLKDELFQSYYADKSNQS